MTKIVLALQENIHFMWLSGNSTLDLHTIHDFRGKRLKEHISEKTKDVFNIKKMNNKLAA